MSIWRYMTNLFPLLLLTLALVGCGGMADMEMGTHMGADDAHGGHGEHGEGLPPIEGAPEIRIVATEFGYEPSTLNLKLGEPVNIVLVNEGSLPHDLDVPEVGFHIHAEGGETTTVGLTPDKTGEFPFICTIAGHEEAGMIGQMIVTE
jgi:plastocyanin